MGKQDVPFRVSPPPAAPQPAAPPAKEDNPFAVEAEKEKAAPSPYNDQDTKLYSSDEIRPHMKALLYGPYGYGKTSLLATVARHPAMSPMVILNYEGGLLSIKGTPNVKIVDVHDLSQVETIFWKLIQKTDGYGDFKSVAIDSGTELQAMNLEALAREAFRKKKKSRESPDDIFQEDYGKDTARLRRIFRWYRDAPFHFFITALHKNVFKRDKKDKDAEPELVSVQPAFTNKLGESVAGFCDFVWYIYKDDDGLRWLLPQEHGVFRAKTRGQKFAAALGDKVLIEFGRKDALDLAKLYDLLLQTEGLIPTLAKAATK